MEDLQWKVVPTQKKFENNNQKQIDMSLGAFDKVLIQCGTPDLNHQCNCNDQTEISKQPQQHLQTPHFVPFTTRAPFANDVEF